MVVDSFFFFMYVQNVKKNIARIVLSNHIKIYPRPRIKRISSTFPLERVQPCTLCFLLSSLHVKLWSQSVTFRYCFPCSETLHHSLLTSTECVLAWIGYKDETKWRTGARAVWPCQNKWKLYFLLRFHSQLAWLYRGTIYHFTAT